MGCLCCRCSSRIYQRVRAVDDGFAIVGLVVAAAAALGSVLHGAHDIAVFANPEVATGNADYPNFTDPRGFSTFALFGLGMLVLAVLCRAARFSRPIPFVGAVTGVLAVIVYIGRVTVLFFGPLQLTHARAGGPSRLACSLTRRVRIELLPP